MARRLENWSEIFRALGEALIDVVRAEVTVLAGQLQRSAKSAGVALGLFAVTLLFLAVAVVLALFALVDGVRVGFGWPWWGAALAVAGAIVAVALLLAGTAALILKKRFEMPQVTFRRRLEDHLGWWRERVFGESPARLTEGGAERGGSDEEDG
jgi:hypothetical protein